MLLHQLRPQTIVKVVRPVGVLEWIDTVTQLVLELLAHFTPLSYISYNILSVAKVILPNSDGIHKLTGVEFVFPAKVLSRTSPICWTPIN